MVGQTTGRKMDSRRNKAEEDLKSALNNAGLTAILAAIGDAITIQGRDYRILYQNQAAIDIIGNHVGECCYKAYEGREHICEGCPVALSFEDGETHTSERSVLTPGGAVVLENTASALKDPEGNIIAGIEVVRDITGRKRAEEELRESREHYRSLFENMLNGYAYCRMVYEEGVPVDFVYLDVNPAFETLTGLYEVCGKTVCELIPGIRQSSPELFETYGRVAISGKPERFEIYVEALSIWFDITVYSPKRGYFVAVFDNITERKRTQEALRKSEEFNRSILESVGEGIIVIGRDYRIIAANRAFCEQAGTPLEELLGRPCYICSHHIDKPCKELGMKCPLEAVFETAEPLTALHVHRDGKGNPVYLEIRSFPLKDASGKVTAIIEVINDITESKKLEAQLRHSQKMEAVGTLAGGIAHDFNNMLNVILGYGSMVMDHLGGDQTAQEQLREVLAAGERAARLTNRLLLFSRKMHAEFKPLDINEMVANIAKMLSRIIGEDISLVTDLMGSQAMVMADLGQMEQVLVNLATNARDAMPGGGTLTISTELRTMDAGFIEASGYGVPGDYAVISVTDTGVGIEKERQERIFDPYFTTKEAGKGTGLGLSIAYGIIKQHNGYIKVYSEPGRGTTFKIWLPVIEAAEAEKAVSAETHSPEGGSETILIAEDDASMRKFTKTVLESFGYSVIAAEDGQDAVSKFMENRDRIALVVLDVIMPRKGGREAGEIIRGASPRTKILFTSGYSMGTDKIHELTDAGFDFISKPIRPKDFLRRVREILDR